jgi:hypothetical protein
LANSSWFKIWFCSLHWVSGVKVHRSGSHTSVCIRITWRACWNISLALVCLLIHSSIHSFIHSFGTGSHYIAQAGLELSVQSRRAWNSWFSCLPSPSITSMHHHDWHWFFWHYGRYRQQFLLYGGKPRGWTSHSFFLGALLSRS